jgi:hypothetical protein
MPSFSDAAYQRWIAVSDPSENEKGRVNSSFIECRQHLIGSPFHKRLTSRTCRRIVKARDVHDVKPNLDVEA